MRGALRGLQLQLVRALCEEDVQRDGDSGGGGARVSEAAESGRGVEGGGGQHEPGGHPRRDQLRLRRRGDE